MTRRLSVRRPPDDEIAFLSAIAADPDDDTARLVFADWLDDHDRPERAWLCRWHIRDDHPDRDAGPAITRVVAAAEKLWDGPNLIGPGHFARISETWRMVLTGGPFWFHLGEADGKTVLQARVVRGFVERVTCTQDDFAKWGHLLLAAEPAVQVVAFDDLSARRIAEWPASPSRGVYALYNRGHSGVSGRYYGSYSVLSRYWECGINNRGSQCAYFETPHAALEAASAAALTYAKKRRKKLYGW